jgi:hypothetical protein
MLRCSVPPSVECATLTITIRKFKELFEVSSKGFSLEHLHEDLKNA